jgi:hypothetical protein
MHILCLNFLKKWIYIKYFFFVIDQILDKYLSIDILIKYFKKNNINLEFNLYMKKIK